MWYIFFFLLPLFVSGLPKFEIAVENADFAVFSRDLNEPPNGYEQIKAASKLQKVINLDQQQKLQLKFAVKNLRQNAAVAVHQAFVVFVHADTQHELFYMPELDTKNNVYSLNLNMKTHYKAFNGLNGKYAVRLIFGDATAANAIDWHFVDVDVDVAPVQSPVVPKSKRINYEPLPEIQHMFAKPEPRPPQIVSDAFAALCALPLLALVALWIKLGVNFKNFRVSLWALGFHVGLAAILVLYYFYWTTLNMFETLQYLASIGLFTFVCGNRFLYNVNVSKKQKTE